MENKNKPFQSKAVMVKKKNFNPDFTGKRRKNTGYQYVRNVSQLSVNDVLFSDSSSAGAVVLDSNTAMGPYEAWKIYLPHEEYDATSDTVKKLKIIENYLSKIVDAKKAELEKHQSFTVDIKQMLEDEDMRKSWPGFLSDLQNDPKEVINYFGLVMHHILYQDRMHELLQESHADLDEEFDSLNTLPFIRAKFSGYDLMPFKGLKMNTYKKFVSVKGTVIRVGNVNTLCTKLAFKCNRCQNIQVILQPSGNFTVPNHCITKPCQSRSFEPMRQSDLTVMIPWQNIRLQELANDENSEKGRVPRTIECELLRDLVDRCVPGDIVTISGIVQVVEPKEKSFGFIRNKSTYVLYILANNVECLKEKNPDSLEVMPGGLKLDLSDLYAVREIHARENLFNLLIASLCPNIYGHEIVKAGLLLSLFGGTQKFMEDNNRVPVRGDSHVLIVGDPGLGKSQMLLACANVSPRGVYVCGNTSTSSGLTVTVTKEAGGENALDAGALVLADQGCCCIDEFDKMTHQHHALLEAMEQQTISIAKCGMSCVLPARTSIIAAANPVGGHYNKAKTVSENIKLGSALLSRFDLVFIVIDKADIEQDRKLSAHVMSMHREKTSNSIVPLLEQPSSSKGHSSLLNSKNLLVENLRIYPQDNTNLVTTDCLRKYIAYARKYVHPKLSPEAAKILGDFYIDLRKQHQSLHSTPITNRQLESMIRLTEARARVELREICSATDAQEVVDIMKFSMVDTYSDEFGNIDFERSIHGSGMSKQSKVKKILSHLSLIASRKNSSYFTLREIEDIAKDQGINKSGFNDLIENLNYQGYLIKKGPGLYQLQSL